ncbi:SH3 domain-containing protein [Mariannaea sp. PMI_226]|nr:SH3 domain-containing protein [Mariannaea sp. PMI_226]
MFNSLRSKSSASVQTVSNKLKLKKTTAGDDHNVSLMVAEYENIHVVLQKIIDDATRLQVSWHDMAYTQLGISEAFKDLYNPIATSVDETDEPRITRVATPTPQLQCALNFQDTCTGLQQELVDEITGIESLLLRPATDAQAYLLPLKKDIKKRDKTRVDYENALSKSTKLKRKPGRTPKEEVQLEKAQSETQVLLAMFEEADTHLRKTLFPLINAASEIIPYLLASVVLIQNRLLGIYYTIMHEFCLDNNFPSPAPDMDVVASDWSGSFQPIVEKVESFAIVRKHSLPMVRRSATDRPPVRHTTSLQRPPTVRIPSAPASNSLPPATSTESPQPSSNTYSKTAMLGNSGVPTDFTTATVLRGKHSMSSLQHGQYSASFSQAAIAKKKPPPPPVPKIKPQCQFVEALYDFQGEGVGDLSFRAGDRIRIIQKTDTDQDWWQGELGGCQGHFPANYCRLI